MPVRLLRSSTVIVVSLAFALTAQLSCGTSEQAPETAAQVRAQLQLDVTDICYKSSEMLQEALRRSHTAEGLAASRLEINRRMTHELGTLVIPQRISEGFSSLQTVFVARDRLTARLLAIARAHRALPTRLIRKRNALTYRVWRRLWDMELDCQYY